MKYSNNYNMKMEYRKIINLLESAPNQPSKFRAKNCIEINDDIRGVYSPNKKN